MLARLVPKQLASQLVGGSQAWAPLALFSSTSQGAKVLAESEAEKKIAQKLVDSLKSCLEVSVVDTSGGCGAMYSIHVVADDFKDLRTMKQHQLVYKILSEDIAQWHGLNLTTKASSKP